MTALKKTVRTRRGVEPVHPEGAAGPVVARHVAYAPPGPNGLLQGRHVPPALLPPRRPLTPRVVPFPQSS